MQPINKHRFVLALSCVYRIMFVARIRLRSLSILAQAHFPRIA